MWIFKSLLILALIFLLVVLIVTLVPYAPLETYIEVEKDSNDNE